MVFASFDGPSVAQVWIYHLLLFYHKTCKSSRAVFLESGWQPPIDVITRSFTFTRGDIFLTVKEFLLERFAGAVSLCWRVFAFLLELELELFIALEVLEDIHYSSLLPTS